MTASVLLAVDDRPDNLFVLEQLLATHLPDIKLLAAPSAEAGLKLAASEAVDGALIDVQMPGMNGIEMCRRLKADPRTASIHVILVAAHRATSALKAQGLEAGADDFIAKPIDNVELAAKLRVMLRLRAAENALRRERDHLEEAVRERTKALRDAEYRYRTLFHAAGDAIFINDLEGRLLEVNEEACRRLGYTREELLRLTISDVATPEYVARRAEILEQLRAAGHLVFETELVSRDGRIIPTECSSRMMDLLDLHGRPAVLSIARDITERKRAEEALREWMKELRESEERFRLLVESAPEAIFVQTQSRFVYLNPAAIQCYGAESADQLLGQAVLDRFDPRFHDLVRERIRLLKEEKKAVPMVEQIHFKMDGAPFDVQLAAVPIHWEGHDGALVFFRDITERRRAEEALALHTTQVQALLDLHLLAQAPPEQILDFVLEASLKVTQSEYCWVGLLDEAESIMTIHRWSKKVMKQCAITDKPILYPISEAGLWGDCVRQRKAVRVNDYQASRPGKKGIPAGHVPIRRFLAVPVLDGGRTVAVAAVANKGTDYTEDDIRAITSLVNKMWELLRRKLDEEALKESLARTTEVQYGTIEALSAVSEVRDPYTAGHQRRVTRLACAVARELGLPADRVAGLRVMGLLHDMGKISIPAEILSKPGKLSDSEFGLIKSHAQAGYEIVKEIRFPWPVAEVILQHHERMDGSGYPQGLKDDEIILEAKILAVADVVEAMSSHRPYRAGLGLDQALETIARQKGVLYDPEVVDACVKVCAEDKFTFE